MKTLQGGAVAVVALVGLLSTAGQAQAEVDLQSLLKEGLLGAGVGAISAGVSKGNAGTGALVGAGTNIIGGSLLSFLTSSSSRSQQAVYAQPVYSQPVYEVPQLAPTYTYTQPVYTQPARVEPVYAPVQQTPVYSYSNYDQPQEDAGKKVLKQGLLGAGVGALSAGTSGGNAGTGALVGAGTNVIGGALLDFLSGPSTTSRTSAAAQPIYQYAPPATNFASTRTSAAASSANTQNLQHRIVRTFNAEGQIISEEEFWQ